MKRINATLNVAQVWCTMHRHMYIFLIQKNQTGGHGRNGLPVAVVVVVDFLTEEDSVFPQSVLIMTQGITNVMGAVMNGKDVMSNVVQVRL